MEDLKNDAIVARIKKELAASLNLQPKTQLGASKIPEVTSETPKHNSSRIKQEFQEQPKKECSDFLWDKAKRKNKSYSKERWERFKKMVAEGEPANKEKKEKCYRPLNELGKPKDQIRCPLCGVLFNRAVYALHEFVCKGKKKKSKFGCMSCSYTDSNLKELEVHILKEHPKKMKKQ